MEARARSTACMKHSDELFQAQRPLALIRAASMYADRSASRSAVARSASLHEDLLGQARSLERK